MVAACDFINQGLNTVKERAQLGKMGTIHDTQQSPTGDAAATQLEGARNARNALTEKIKMAVVVSTRAKSSRGPAGRGDGGCGGNWRRCHRAKTPAHHEDDNDNATAGDQGEVQNNPVIPSQRPDKTIIAEACMQLVTSMQSKQSFQQAQRLFAAVPLARNNFQIASIPSDLDIEKRTLLLLQNLRPLVLREPVAQYIERRCAFVLYRELTSRRRSQGLQTMPCGEHARLAQMAGMQENAFISLVEWGKRLYLLCGGHLGLLVTIPVDSTVFPRGTFSKKQIRSITMDQAGTLADALRDNEWARTMCTLGMALDEHLFGDTSEQTPQTLSILGPDQDLKALTRRDIDRLLRPYVTRRCQCTFIH